MFQKMSKSVKEFATKKLKKIAANYYYPFGEFALTATETLVSLNGLMSTPMRVGVALGLGAYTAIETKAFQVPYITGEKNEDAYFIEPPDSKWQSYLKWFLIYPSVISASLLQKFCENYTVWMSTRSWINAIYEGQSKEEIEPLSETELGIVLAWTFLIDLPFGGLTGMYALCQELRETWNLPATKAPDFIKRIANNDLIRPLIIYPGAAAESLETALAAGSLFHPSLLRQSPEWFALLLPAMGVAAGASYYQSKLFDGGAIDKSLREIGEDPSSAEDSIINLSSQKVVRAAQFFLWCAVLTNALFAMLPPVEFLLESWFNDPDSYESYAAALIIGVFATGIPVTWGVYQSEIKTALERCHVQDENLGIIAGRAKVIREKESRTTEEDTEMRTLKSYGAV